MHSCKIISKRGREDISVQKFDYQSAMRSHHTNPDRALSSLPTIEGPP